MGAEAVGGNGRRLWATTAVAVLTVALLSPAGRAGEDGGQAVRSGDPGQQRALIGTSSGLMAVDLATGERRLLSGVTDDGVVGAGPPLPGGGRFEVAGDRGVAYGLATGYIVRIDLATGDRQLVSAAQTHSAVYGSAGEFGPRGVGPSDVEDGLFDLPLSDLALDTKRDRALILAQAPKGSQIWAVDLDSGDRRLLADGNTFEPTPLDGVSVSGATTLALEFRPREGDLVLYDGADIKAIEPESGQVEPLHLSSVADLPPRSLRWIGCTGFELGNEGHSAYLQCDSIMTPTSLHELPYDANTNFVLKVEPLDGEREILAGPEHGTGFPVYDPEAVELDHLGIVHDPARQRLLMLASVAGCVDAPLLAVDLETENRRVVSFHRQCGDAAEAPPSVGDGPRLMPSSGGERIQIAP